MRACLTGLLLVLTSAQPVLAGGRVLYAEAQSVAGFSSASGGPVLYSFSQEDAMQKPSVGVDWLQKLEGDGRDIGTLAFQGRMAWNRNGQNTFEPQVYNAYYKLKLRGGGLWVGHDKPAFGLSYIWDTHARLLYSPVMYGFGYDRDWGMGWQRDGEDGSLVFSLTSGSGMPLRMEGNWMASGRVSRGVLARDNWEAGFSASHGKRLDTMGYTVMGHMPETYSMLAADWTYTPDMFEFRAEVDWGWKDSRPERTFFLCAGANLAEEGRLKIEYQPSYSENADVEGWLQSAGLSWQFSPYLTGRAAFTYRAQDYSRQVTTQLYWYFPL